MPMNGEELVKRQEKLQSDRATWESLWQEVAEYMRPHYAYFTTESPTGGESQTEKIYNDIPLRANNVLASGIHGQNTSPHKRWFELRFPDEKVMNDREVKQWLDEATKTIYKTLNASNFNTEIHKYYQDHSSFGTACIYCEEHPQKPGALRFDNRFLGEIYIAENAYGEIDTVYRKFKLTARQATQEFDKNKLSKQIREKADKEPDEKFEFLHCVQPREERDATKKDAQNYPYASVYVEVDQKNIVLESGYLEMPYMVGRWSTSSGEIYGRGPGIDNLRDIKMLNQASQDMIMAANRAVDPPLMAPDDGFLMPVDISSGAINYYNRGMLEKNDGITPIHLVDGFPIGQDFVQTYEMKIQQAFFNDLFLMIMGMEDKTMTATEVNARVEEKMVMLGPTLGRIQRELLDPILKRVFGILWRAGKFSPAPRLVQEMLQYEEYQPEIDYISPLAQAQRATGANAIARTLQMAAPFGEVNPEIYDNFDADWTLREIGNMFGAPTSMFRDKKDVAKIRQQRSQQAEMQQRLDNLEKLLPQASKAAETASRVGGGL